ncbi:DUF1877 family protein [Nostoc sp. FACHB-87]|uniref:DUF1877 family protein n=1 Tax=Nostocaceae TaxID=1162 RepID=UPI001688E4B9|nr:MULTISPECIES: DUF1877 family protein [Nostocaceae]MBD2297797.1 DUF1877 family protein [Nostoc sp. FACHB-190]MBD2454852.1 DUF1877 family protein [Nostoc sp. FACHB-87]MBD2476690.1 DUF1877 family protein [Anabaena sp. FACHB-83]
MSIELSLIKVNYKTLHDIESFLIQWNDNYDGETHESFEVNNGLPEVLSFLLTGSTDISAAWFSDSPFLVQEISIPNYGNLLLVDALAGGICLKSLRSHGLVAICLTVEQVQEVAQALSKISQEDLASRWDALNLFANAERRKIIGGLEKLQPNFRNLEQSVENIEDFSEYFINEFVAYYIDAAQNNMGIVILDCT